MAAAPSAGESGPQMALMQLAAARDGMAERWRIDWLVTNAGIHAMQVLSARLPHGQFKSEEFRFKPALNLQPGEKTEFKVLVQCEEPPGLVTENAFVIFQVKWLGEPWRIFVRIRVVMADDGRPESRTESITTQKVGFSGVAS